MNANRDADNHGFVSIDFGGSHCRVTVYVEDHIEYIPNQWGNYETPTCVAFTSSGDDEENSTTLMDRILIGQEALEYSILNPHCSFWDFKRLIGKSFSGGGGGQEEFEKICKSFPFQVSQAVDEKHQACSLKVYYQDSVKEFTIVEMIGLILTQLKEDAERYLKHSISDIVISIPNYYTNCQREAMFNAGKSAGVNVIRIIHDTSAACFQFGMRKRGDDEKHCFVFDLGRSGCSASVITIDRGVYDVKTTDGISNLGGYLLDESLVEYCCEEYFKAFKKRLQENPISMRRLYLACEEAKKKLSQHLQYDLSLKSLMDEGIDFEIALTRSLFEELNSHFFSKCIDLAEKVFLRSRLNKMDLNSVILIGGGAEIPKLKQLFTNYFEQSLHPKSIFPYPVAYGAAIQGGIMSSFEPETLLLESLSRDIGCEVSGGNMSILIGKETDIPCSKIHKFSLPPATNNNNNNKKSSITLKVFEGENKKAEDNQLVGIVTISSADVNNHEFSTDPISLRFEVDTSGYLTVLPESKKIRVEFVSFPSQV